jgi:anti-sigma factor RsiW
VSLTCAQLEDVAAELALGTVSGAERAVALDHLAGCPACRELVDQLARAADSLLLLAPSAEPPPGFESKVLSRLGVASAPVHRIAPRRRRVLVGVAAAVMVAGLSGAALLSTSAGDKPPVEVADVRTALASDVNGHWTCRAVVYGTDPTWLVVSLDRTDGLSAAFSVEAVHAGDDTPVPVGTFTIDQGHGSLAKAVPLPAGDLRSVRVLDAGGRLRYEMTFPST